jgi:D-arabinan exo alpha-(1,3)/(1,5)-arabinofuranosidase (non-reducing end)
VKPGPVGQGAFPSDSEHDSAMDPVWNPAFVDPSLDSRAVTFENPTGGRGRGGAAHGGRKGAPNRTLQPGERVVLADLDGPGVIRHLWLTFLPARPERMRGLVLEVFYDDATDPSVSVPCLDFFGLPHGRPVAYHSALTTAQEGRGFNSYIPMPFRRHVRVELVNGADRPVLLYYQIDVTLQRELSKELGVLHATFRRENPTMVRRDFVIAGGLRGPGRFLGCNVGVRVIDAGDWYGEGEVKVYRDGDTELPTICGTGLEDYVGSAWGMGTHSAPYGGAPLILGDGDGHGMPDFVGFYRWHVPDPIMFERDLRVTIQQIGAVSFRPGQEAELEAYERTNPVAGEGWHRDIEHGILAWGITERVDDYCATAYVYCRDPQPVPRVDLAAALADIERRDYELGAARGGR